VMEGCQHNTMDVEYYGPNPQMGIWYLGALRAAEEMARYLGDQRFADDCRALFENGSRWVDEQLFNGEYYEHQIRPILDKASIAPSLLIGMGASDPNNPDYQLGSGCLVDQLVGQFLAHACGLGYLVKPENVRTTLKSIKRYNRRDTLHNHFNCMRSFALDGESGLLMASYPKGRPANPFPYFTEIMTGFEYTAAVGMLYEGLSEDGLESIQDIRARYDGQRRSPFDEAECGHHYARAMASWGAVLALSGFDYSAVKGEMVFASNSGNFFWSNGYACGSCVLSTQGNVAKIELSVLQGDLSLTRFQLRDFGVESFVPARTIGTGQKLSFEVARA
jgi:non-lysosomal glucosylceramidase